jgi:hypothetical protein
VFENRAIRRLFGSNKDEVTGELSCTMMSFIFCSHPQIILGRSNQGERGGPDMWYAWERKEECVQGFLRKARRK